MLALDDAADSDRVADWIELELSLGEESFSRARMSSLVRNASGEDASEPFISDVWRHLERRERMYQEKFFLLEDDLIKRNNNVVNGRLE